MSPGLLGISVDALSASFGATSSQNMRIKFFSVGFQLHQLLDLKDAWDGQFEKPQDLREFQVRCIGCSRWEARSAFPYMVVKTDDEDRPGRTKIKMQDDPDSTLCNSCFVRVSGRCQETATKLAQQLIKMMEKEEKKLIKKLVCYWVWMISDIKADEDELLDLFRQATITLKELERPCLSPHEADGPEYEYTMNYYRIDLKAEGLVCDVLSALIKSGTKGITAFRDTLSGEIRVFRNCSRHKHLSGVWKFPGCARLTGDLESVSQTLELFKDARANNPDLIIDFFLSQDKGRKTLT
ncbi:hypothetical protein QBC38DRAFT_446782 [Podospora fimiseda]|uniref:Uncharacterized protein n=1 Tax=Podospora fimiseda TaxID=252190 RepID=A0AAN7GPS3_9PEZI|nr:hypothetical protein QBC38DRAFT_446782 [Podospora fimiseda]